MSIADEKESIRQEMKERRSRGTAAEVAGKSRDAAARLMNLPEWKAAKTVMLYWALEKEVQTQGIMAADKRVLLPKIGEATLLPAVFEEGNMVNGRFGIPEPAGEPAEGLIDMVIVPGLAFGRDGGRIGFGKGYYDRFLAGKEVTKIGFSFGFQLCDKVPQESHDVPMDIIVTEKEVVQRKR